MDFELSILNSPNLSRPTCTAIVAMTADGKIADYQHSPAYFGSKQDKIHLEKQISLMDGVLIGAGTLRAYGTSLSLRNPDLIRQRQARQQPDQPIHLICSQSGQIKPDLPFFRQPIPRWLLTHSKVAREWQIDEDRGFSRILTIDPVTESPWRSLMAQLWDLGLRKVGVLGGGTLIAALLAEDLIDDLWLTICPLILGGENAPTPVEGSGFSADQAKYLTLLSVETVEQELFLHYLVQR